MEQSQPQIINVRELITNDNLKIPSYQRPYKWTTKNETVAKLIWQKYFRRKQYFIPVHDSYRDNVLLMRIEILRQRQRLKPNKLKTSIND